MLYVFALPFAGGSSLSFMSWKAGEGVSFHPMDYRGHGIRMKEPFDDSILSVAEDMAGRIASILLKDFLLKDSSSKDFAENGHAAKASDMAEQDGRNRTGSGAIPEFLIFGHSLGAIVGYHTALILQEQYHMIPKRLCLSACAAPEHFPAKQLNFATEQEMTEFLLATRQIDAKQMEKPFYRKHIKPILIHDFRIIDDYRYRPELPLLTMPIIGFSGDADTIAPGRVMPEWARYTEKELRLYELPGDHFYMNNPDNAGKILEICTQDSC